MKPTLNPGGERIDFLFVHTEACLPAIGTDRPLPPLSMIQMATFLDAEGYDARVIDTRHPGFSLGFFSDYLHLKLINTGRADCTFIFQAVLTNKNPNYPEREPILERQIQIASKKAIVMVSSNDLACKYTEQKTFCLAQNTRKYAVYRHFPVKFKKNQL